MLHLKFAKVTLLSISATTVAYTLSKTIHLDRIKPKPKMIDSQMSTSMTKLVFDIQNNMTAALQELEAKKQFFFDEWKESDRYGISAVLQDGETFEKAGVNVSIIKSKAPESMIQQMSSRKMDVDTTKSYDFFVAGVSMVIHPRNPMAPTFHANYRYFELLHNGTVIKSWFGGGCDLTPCYLFEEDAVHFHQTVKQVCDRHDSTYYSKFKAWCDKYFYNTHRGEARGIGGIFFDDLNTGNPKNDFEFVKDAGNALVNQYIPILQKRINMPFTPEQKEWQQIRRGRYVEFNLIHDRGTKFGLVTPGVRIESVLMSLPLTARWEYKHSPQIGSPEEKCLKVLKAPREWV